MSQRVTQWHRVSHNVLKSPSVLVNWPKFEWSRKVPEWIFCTRHSKFFEYFKFEFDLNPLLVTMAICSIHTYYAQWDQSLITMYDTRCNLLCIYISVSLLPVYLWLRKWIVIKLETQLWCSNYYDKFNIIVLKWMKWIICKFTSKGQYALKSLNFLCDIIKIHTVKFVKS